MNTSCSIWQLQFSEEMLFPSCMGTMGDPGQDFFGYMFMSLIFLGGGVVVCCCFLFLLLLYFVDFLVVFLVIIIIMSYSRLH